MSTVDSKVSLQTIREIAKRSNLTSGIVVALLNAGYTYVEGINLSPQWEKITAQ